MEAVETRVAVIAIIVRDGTQVAALNDCCTSTDRISWAAWAYPTGKRA